MDSESEYNYTASDAKLCCKAGAARHVASIDSHNLVPPKNEAQLSAAVLLNPVSAMIDGTSPAIQHYKSGVLDDPTLCTAAPSHAVTVVGQTKDYFVIKNSWGTTCECIRLSQCVQTTATRSRACSSACRG
jgi:KDEL-tailed cysteine endopeptidase